mmetsp:Transcript_117129/g.213144  ORF Transcript_117129/g.213144 Transcript_117129/m.213144 type:complete len:293 (-) Transcript_117129:416-1294(-)
MGGKKSKPAPPPPAPGPSAQEIQRQLQQAQQQEAAARAEQQRIAQEHQRQQAAAAARAQELQKREAALRAQEHESLRKRQKIEREAAEAKEKEEQARKQIPAFLNGHLHKVNAAVIGNTGAGKSLFVNVVRGVGRKDAAWAPVGVTETTMEPTPYQFPGEAQALLWDIPGTGTAAFPREKYIRTFGLRHFDIVIIISAGRFTETELLLLEDLRKAGKAVLFMVRSKVDVDICNNEADNGMTADATKQQIRTELVKGSSVQPYLISSRQRSEHDFDKLCRGLRDACQAASTNK